MTSAAVRPRATPAFDAAAEFYDHAPNPLLALEQRFLPGLLPSLRSRVVLDVGCGTGRWLYKLQDSAAAQLIGVDPSLAMLDLARGKVRSDISLLQGTAECLPLPDGSADVILMSFALSYCDRLEPVVHELARVARPNATIFISDLHPRTEARLNWKRTFASQSGTLTMATARHGLRELEEISQRSGFHPALHLELPFGTQERSFFVRAGKEFAFHAARELPAIYIAQFIAQKYPPNPSVAVHQAQVAFGPKAAAPASISIANDRIASISSSHKKVHAAHEVDLQGCVILPGLINAHDHLEFGLYPNIGSGPYDSSREWAKDIHANYSDMVARQNRIGKDVRLYWGALRNLLAGVSTVCHHNPQAVVFRDPDFPVRVVDKVSWAHSLCFDQDVQSKFACSSPQDPFVIHAAEGNDRASAAEITELDRLGVLTDRTVVVHGLNCSSNDIELMNERGAALICCPSSNLFLFKRTLSPGLLQRARHSALATDSPLTAAGNLLDEIKLAGDALQLTSRELYEMCTARPASILRLRDGEGTISVDGYADFIAVRDTGDSPASRLLQLQMEDIELVFVGGRVHLASEGMMTRLPDELTAGLFLLQVDGFPRWVRAPLPLMFADAEAVLGRNLFLGRKRVTYAG